jgi:hypothetical protein
MRVQGSGLVCRICFRGGVQARDGWKDGIDYRTARFFLPFSSLLAFTGK